MNKNIFFLTGFFFLIPSTLAKTLDRTVYGAIKYARTYFAYLIVSDCYYYYFFNMNVLFFRQHRHYPRGIRLCLGGGGVVK